MRHISILRFTDAAVGRNGRGITGRISPSVWGAVGASSNDGCQPLWKQLPQHKTTHLRREQCRRFTSINNQTSYNICFLRHGQSTWNRDNRFIGWTDTPLTDDGVLEARVAGKMLKNSGILFDEVHTSLLRRCIRTTNLVLMEVEQEYIPVYKHWRLNERSYGELVGKKQKGNSQITRSGTSETVEEILRRPPSTDV